MQFILPRVNTLQNRACRNILHFSEIRNFTCRNNVCFTELRTHKFVIHRNEKCFCAHGFAVLANTTCVCARRFTLFVTAQFYALFQSGKIQIGVCRGKFTFLRNAKCVCTHGCHCGRYGMFLCATLMFFCKMHNALMRNEYAKEMFSGFAHIRAYQ